MLMNPSSASTVTIALILQWGGGLQLLYLSDKRIPMSVGLGLEGCLKSRPQHAMAIELRKYQIV